MKLYNKIKSKLRERRGASIIMALLFFLVVVMVSSVVIIAASSNLTRTKERWSEEQAYLTLSSAALYLDDKLNGINFIAWEAQTVYKCEKQSAYVVEGQTYDPRLDNYPDCMDAEHIHPLTIYEGGADEGEGSSIDDGIEKLIISMAYDITRTKIIYNTAIPFSDISSSGADGYISVSLKINADEYNDIMTEVNAELRMYSDYKMRIILSIPDYTYSLILSFEAFPEELPSRSGIESFAYDRKVDNVNEGTGGGTAAVIYGETFGETDHQHEIKVREKYFDASGSETWHEVTKLLPSTITVYMIDYKVEWGSATITKGSTYTG